jgi:hypothetical protein
MRHSFLLSHYIAKTIARQTKPPLDAGNATRSRECPLENLVDDKIKDVGARIAH